MLRSRSRELIWLVGTLVVLLFFRVMNGVEQNLLNVALPISGGGVRRLVAFYSSNVAW